MSQNNKSLYKQFQFPQQNSESHSSEEDLYATNLWHKKQQPSGSSNQVGIKSEIEIEPSRQNRNRNKNDIENKKTKKRNKNNAGIEAEVMIKKQKKKKNAAPPQIITDGSKSSSSKSQHQQKFEQERAAPDHPKQSRRLYIGNLHFQITQSHIRKIFKKYGNIKQAKVVINSTTGKSKGFGFVQYTDTQSAIKAKYQLCSHIFNGQKINIQFCQIQ